MHISHFKPMAQDKYQQELLKLIKSGIVRVYGKKWDKVGIKAKPLSYWQVNKMFAASSTCYGLMYPYQRGKTLSGRMWQAPLHGCFVISEAGTNIAGCPGVIEVSSFSAGNFTALDYSIEQCRSLAIDAARHWRTATQKLAEELGQVLEIAKQFNQNISEGRLGGYTRTSDIFPHGDPNTWCPELWKWAHDTLCIRSVLDVGCGEGHSAAYFKEIGCDVLGVDGSIEAKKSSRIPQFHVIHDFENGPFIPNKAYDLIWSCEFVEHVSEDKVNNIMKTFGYGKKYIMMSYAEPGQAGWHHVNCKPEEYWIKKILGIGFRIDLRLTKTGRRMAGAGHFAEKGLIFRRSNTIMRFIAFCYYRFSGI